MKKIEIEVKICDGCKMFNSDGDLCNYYDNKSCLEEYCDGTKPEWCKVNKITIEEVEND